jgi:16S rRNA (guanine(966)-N(2))-methyltransferase RsmD
VPRVIAGRLGGRTLVAPAGAATRPTSDRVREALFSILGDLEGAVVLDLFAGTGALGIEALSRGASRATFVENARPALRALGQNLDRLDLRSQAVVLSTSVGRALSAMSWGAGAFDVVFMDPPYREVREGTFDLALARAVETSLAASVRTGGTVVLEHAKNAGAPDVPGLTLAKTRVYGDTALSFYFR